ncbi:deoxyribodipyrimidine photo-lyase [Plasmodium gonderi]|uniref:Deoxyribodipyrimidine photo-lyase n=1 Tax=Plasmodium gonderi TaxID=77519 RepID=A0A1Y1JGP4_PLAGO|nr:deoxyribodipyrimidine photo-lyase [Plasmodium gonderi]GAW81420.1 deoxyribodipyrimidine photo-lyase [Plasmodium gonderi]
MREKQTSGITQEIMNHRMSKTNQDMENLESKTTLKEDIFDKKPPIDEPNWKIGEGIPKMTLEKEERLNNTKLIDKEKSKSGKITKLTHEELMMESPNGIRKSMIDQDKVSTSVLWNPVTVKNGSVIKSYNSIKRNDTSLRGSRGALRGTASGTVNSATSGTRGNSMSGTRTNSMSGTRTNSMSGTRTNSMSGTRTNSMSGTRTNSMSGTRTNSMSGTRTNSMSGTRTNSMSGTRTNSMSGTRSNWMSGTRSNWMSVPRKGHANLPTSNSSKDHHKHNIKNDITGEKRVKYSGQKKGTASLRDKRKVNTPLALSCSEKESNTNQRFIEEKKRKRNNPYETSRERKLHILAKRVRCLTSFETDNDNNSERRDAINTISNLPEEGIGSVNPSSNMSEGVKDVEILNPNHQPSVENEESNILLLLTRDFRVNDNWTLIYAHEMGMKKKCNLIACTYIDRKEKVTNRYINTKLKILKNLENGLKKLNIPFYVLPIYMIDEFIEFLKSHKIKIIICDFHVLEEQRTFIKSLSHLCNKKKIKIFQIDSHNIIPTWITSKVEECSARTIRPKIQSLLPTFLIEYIILEPYQQNFKFPEPFDINDMIKKLTFQNTCPPITNFVCTEKKAHEILTDFCKNTLDKYNVKRSDPNSDVSNLLLPYVNLGVISAQRCVLEVNKHANSFPSINTVRGKESFNDDLIMKKELAENYCYYNKNYDNFNGGKEWAKESLKKHDADKREHLYDYEDFKNAKTHNDIWNCCQLQLINEGVIHEYLKIYWAKKILNWSENSKTALKYAMELNNEFSLDGKTSSGYVTIMWSIMGVHDQSLNERNIFGKIRYMNYNGCKRSFDMNMYISKYPKGRENAQIVQKIPTMTFASYLKKRKNCTLAQNPELKKEKR